MSLLSEADKAHDIYDTIVNAIMGGKASNILLAQALYEIKKKKLYKKAIGAGVDTWEQFLFQPEINLTRYEARKLIKTYEYFCVKHDFNEGDIADASMDNLWHVAKRDVELDDRQINLVVEGAKTLSHNHFKEEFHDIFDGEERTYSYLVMQRCDQTNNLRKVHGIDTEEILDTWEIEENRPAKIKSNCDE